MIEIHYEAAFQLDDEDRYRSWIEQVIRSEGRNIGTLSYIFCTDSYLLTINQTYLKHDTYTDIISFDYSDDHFLSMEIYISVERVAENAKLYGCPFEEELLRVMAHGLLHGCGYLDKSRVDRQQMRMKEEEKMRMFHVEQQ